MRREIVRRQKVTKDESNSALGTLVGDVEIDFMHPEALIYKPVGHKRHLAGVEYIVDAAIWLKSHNSTPPSRDGQDFQFVGAPNCFNLALFFELHVWTGATIREMLLSTGTATTVASIHKPKPLAVRQPSRLAPTPVWAGLLSGNRSG